MRLTEKVSSRVDCKFELYNNLVPIFPILVIVLIN